MATVTLARTLASLALRETEAERKRIEQTKARLREDASRGTRHVEDEKQRLRDRAQRRRERLERDAPSSFEETVGAMLGAGIGEEIARRIGSNPDAQLSLIGMGCQLGATLGRSLR